MAATVPGITSTTTKRQFRESDAHADHHSARDGRHFRESNAYAGNHNARDGSMARGLGTMAEATITSAHVIVGVADTAMEMTADHMNTANATRTSARLLT